MMNTERNIDNLENSIEYKINLITEEEKINHQNVIKTSSFNNLINLNTISTERGNCLKENINLSSQKIENEANTLRKVNFSFSIGNININDNNNLSILVIDDNKFIRDSTVYLIKSVMSFLKIYNFKIVEGSDGIDMLNLVRMDKANKIKLIFTDESMEYLCGSDAVRLIRKFEECKKIKNYNIISITAFDDIEMRNRILSCGINSVVSKPCTKTEMIEILTKLQI